MGVGFRQILFLTSTSMCGVCRKTKSVGAMTVFVFVAQSSLFHLFCLSFLFVRNSRTAVPVDFIKAASVSG